MLLWSTQGSPKLRERSRELVDPEAERSACLVAVFVKLEGLPKEGHRRTSDREP